MTYTFHRNDATFSQIAYTDISGTPSTSASTSVVTSVGGTNGPITIAASLSIADSTLAINTNNSGGVGAYAICFVSVAGTTINNGATTLGSNLGFAGFNGSGVAVSLGSTPAGTWRNVSGGKLNDTSTPAVTGMFIRTA